MNLLLRPRRQEQNVLLCKVEAFLPFSSINPVLLDTYHVLEMGSPGSLVQTGFPRPWPSAQLLEGKAVSTDSKNVSGNYMMSMEISPECPLAQCKMHHKIPGLWVYLPGLEPCPLGFMRSHGYTLFVLLIICNQDEVAFSLICYKTFTTAYFLKSWKTGLSSRLEMSSQMCFITKKNQDIILFFRRTSAFWFAIPILILPTREIHPAET